MSTKADGELIDLSEDSLFKVSFDRKTLTQFYPSIQIKYPTLSTAALKVLLPFTAYYYSFYYNYISHSLYVSQASLVKLYSEVHVAINQNAGDTSLLFENVRGTFKAIFILASRRNHINLFLIQI
ncbi:hypothetical protein Tsp_10522 [Trichinella spiralis]|uniref:hypothetical protein n=1 Tax=Trichinella spiralis TaxID=6334 RepID=UPI0001EFD56C|nr:hypothetical protein Tsp_10522 [Trichinella spiralis]